MARRASPEINAGSMADIAFLLLIFFLVTTTMDVDSGITRRLPPPVEDPDEDIKIKQRNILNVLVNKNDRLLVDGKPGDIRTLKDVAKNFMIPVYPDDPNHPETELKTIDFIGEVYTSKGVISLKNDRGTSYDMYINVQNELARAFNELKEEMAQRQFGTRYSKLTDKAKIDAINEAVPVRISEAEPENIGD
ncbi:MAG: biopolymer transporter ExbD [Bacteroidetes bacterium]|jgi:biopolymer transport protein ExbD|nr:biopolymer transporter ExbD [Bacteroidota bacterium]MBU1578783.1 biopolymer transporter ExbD [Bacteroidota bacterium]MBU2466161.1 biopolymer transporter ExbD [Bacteroidota bacterium]MBU2557860.1 biopolymer transporter ExbD [Bacteroidota bacterium]MDA3944215.1 biopolymer transporter ExbD [Bacteroidota bacterium]